MDQLEPQRDEFEAIWATNILYRRCSKPRYFGEQYFPTTETSQVIKSCLPMLYYAGLYRLDW